MKLTLWTYEGPPHVGAMRVATAMQGVHYVLHAPQGDSYADLLFTMIERRGQRPPVTYTSFQARDLGGDTAELFKTTLRETYDRFRPQAMLVGASCTGELIQDDPGGLAAASGLDVPVIPLELPAYSRKENWGAAETFYRLVRHLADPQVRAAPRAGRRPCCNLLGATAFGFRNRDDAAEITRLLAQIGVDVAVSAPWGATAQDLARLGAADFNVVLYPETAMLAARHLQRVFGQPHTSIVPIGLGATADFIAEVAGLAGLDPAQAVAQAMPGSRMAWWSRSVDSTYLTGKRVFIFGDATHAIAAARVARDEMGFAIAGLGTYSRDFAREMRAAAAQYGVEPLITDDYLEVEARIIELQPELVLGTQMERHVAKRLGIACAVISAPVHVQDFPARHAPQMGVEGANVLFDTWIHPLVMGLEEHLLTMFRDDFEFNESRGASHLGGHASAPRRPGADDAGQAAWPAPSPDQAAACASPVDGEYGHAMSRAAPTAAASLPSTPANAQAGAQAGAQAATLPRWEAEAEAELRKIPFFVRGKARRNTELFAANLGLSQISLTTLYDAKSHYGR